MKFRSDTLTKTDALDRLERKSILEYLDRKLADPRVSDYTSQEILKQVSAWIRRWRPRTKAPGGRGR